jgi:predicted phage-related endonuclease
LPDALIEHVEELDTIKELLAILEEQKTKCENEIKATMGTTEIAWAGPHKLTWKTASNGVRSLRVTLDPKNGKDEIREKYQRAIDRKRNELEKSKQEAEKESLKA